MSLRLAFDRPAEDLYAIRADCGLGVGEFDEVIWAVRGSGGGGAGCGWGNTDGRDASRMNDMTLRFSHVIKSTLLAWFAMLGFDFFLHGGVLAHWYVQPDPFLLSPRDAFRLIPVGYLCFLIVACTLTWLILRLDIRGARAASVFGLELGGLVWLAFTLALASISTAKQGLLVGWFVGQTIESGIAGAVLGATLWAPRLRGVAVGFRARCLVRGCHDRASSHWARTGDRGQP